MKIVSFETRAVRVAREHAPFAVGGDEIDFVTLKLRTDDGIEGIAYAGFASPVLTGALKATVDGLCGATIGLDAMNTEAVGARLLRLGGGGSTNLKATRKPATRTRSAGIPMAR